MHDRSDASLASPRTPRRSSVEESDEEPIEDPHSQGRMRDLLLQRERATERFRALKLRLLGRR